MSFPTTLRHLSGVAFLLALCAHGCGGSTRGTEALGSSASGTTGPTASLCDQYYAAQYTRCGGPTLPAAETARILARFEQSCEDQGALPGSGVTATALAACVAALDLSSCESPSGGPIACNFHGSLPGGAPCSDGVQCASGLCPGTADDSPDGQIGPFTCGTCAPVVAVGQTCNSAGCPADAICMTTDTTAAQPTYTCTALAEGALGARCDTIPARCEPGLYCDAQTEECATLEGAGATCLEWDGEGSYPGGCSAPLVCNSSCQVGGSAGASCGGDSSCAAGLGCVPGPPSTSSVCTPITWASAGEACSPSGARCLVGSCNTGVSPDGPPPRDAGIVGTCPTVIPDGQPCTLNALSTTCDTFSECFEGKCALIDSVACQ